MERANLFVFPPSRRLRAPINGNIAADRSSLTTSRPCQGNGLSSSGARMVGAGRALESAETGCLLNITKRGSVGSDDMAQVMNKIPDLHQPRQLTFLKSRMHTTNHSAQMMATFAIIRIITDKQDMPQSQYMTAFCAMQPH
eukprot:IDg13505t1